MKPLHIMPRSFSHPERLRTELLAVLNTPLASHQKAIRENHLPIDVVLEGKRPVVLYPAARMATAAAAMLLARGVDVRGFSDNNPARWGQTINGLPVVSPSQIAGLAPDCAVLVASSLYDSDIRELLAVAGHTCIYPMPYLNFCLPEVFTSREYSRSVEAPFRPDASASILQLFDILADDASRQVLVNKVRYYLSLDKRLLDGIKSPGPIYFDPDLYAHSPDDIVVDGGAFNGDTLKQFLRIYDGQFRRYHVFEPDPGVFEKLRQVAAADPGRIECVRAGLSDQTGILNFAVTGAADSAVVTTGDQATVSLPVVDLDSYFSQREPPSLIKMDIEGSERSALEGARQVVGGHHPILAVSSYHYPEDLWEIPLQLLQISAGASLFLRHYTREIDDTVCYAVPPNRLRPVSHGMQPL